MVSSKLELLVPCFTDTHLQIQTPNCYGQFSWSQPCIFSKIKGWHTRGDYSRGPSPFV